MATTIANLGAPAPTGNLLIVDGLNVAFRWKHQNILDYKYDYIRTIESLAKSYKAGTIIVCADGGSTYRKNIHPEYKANRKERYAEQTEQEAKEFEMFMAEFQDTLTLIKQKYPVFHFRGVEADDIAAHLVKFKDKYDLEYIWLISSDRDWDLLIQENVGRFSYVTRKEVRLDNWKEHYDIPPEMYISMKCLTGDKGDNVPGIPGIGPKRATQLIEQYGSAWDIYEAVPIDSKYKFIQALNENADQILVNYELMDLIAYCDEAIGPANILDIECKINEYRN